MRRPIATTLHNVRIIYFNPLRRRKVMSGGIGQTYQAAEKLSLCANPAVILRVALTHERLAGCSKRLFSKAAASEEVPTALRVSRSPLQWVLANGKVPPVFPISEKLLLNVEPLSDARTMLADFFSILLDHRENTSQAAHLLPPGLAGPAAQAIQGPGNGMASTAACRFPYRTH